MLSDLADREAPVRRTIGIALLVLASMVAAHPSVAIDPGSWPQIGGGPRHLGIAAGETAIGPGSAADLRQAWSSTRGGWSAFSSPVVADGLVYIVSGGDLTPSGRSLYLFAFHLADGTAAWSALLGGPSANATTTPAVDAGTIFVPTSEPKTTGYVGRITALDAATGAPRWSTTVGRETSVASPVAVDGSTVLQSSGNGRLYALDEATGAHLWTRHLSEPDGCEIAPGQMGPCPLRSTPAVVGGLAYLVTGDGTLEARRIRNGSLAWASATGLNATATPSAREGRIYVTGPGTMQVFDARTGAPLWQVPIPGNLGYGGQAVTHTSIFIGTAAVAGDHGAVLSLSASDGSVRWTTQLDRLVWGTPAVANGVVFVQSDLAIYALSAGRGEILWQRALGTNTISSPAIAEGHVAAVTVNSGVPLHVYALPG
jgi:outer membrane protein assembly factor BamB